MAGYTLKALSGGTSVQTIGDICVAASSPLRLLLSSVMFGMTTVASAAFTYVVQRETAQSTGTSRTPQADDPADAATTATGKDTVTVDGTLTANAFVLYWPFYQNNSGRWVAVNDRQRKVVPATASNGFALALGAATTVVAGGLLEFEA